MVVEIVERVAQLEHAAQVLCQRGEELIALRREAAQLKKTAEEQAEQNGELTRVLWAVREEYHKLKATSAKTDESNASLQDSLRSLTKDYDTLKKENEAQRELADTCKRLEEEKAQAVGAADESKKKNGELEGLLLAVREEYHKLKLTYDDKEKKLHTVTQRYDELCARAKELTRQNHALVEEVKSARAQPEPSVPPPDPALAAELEHQKQLCEAVRANYTVLAQALQQNRDSATTLRAQAREALERADALQAERDALQLAKAALERAAGARERGANAQAEAARAAAVEEAARLAAEREKFVLDWDRLVLQRERLAAECAAACRERDGALADKARAEEALAIVLLEREAHRAAETAHALAEGTGTTATGYAELCAALVKERTGYADARAALATERANYTQMSSVLMAETLDLRRKVAELERVSAPATS